MNAPKSDDRKAEPWSDLLGDFQLDVWGGYVHPSLFSQLYYELDFQVSGFT